MTMLSSNAIEESPRFLPGRRIHISGSASRATQTTKIRFAHEIVERIAHDIIAKGGGLVLGVGREPMIDEGTREGPALTFDWTALSAAADGLRVSTSVWPHSAGPRIVLVSSEKGESEIPENRRALWEELLALPTVRVERIAAGSRAAALIRRRQAEFGDALLIVGGGFGVEDLATIYASQRRPVVPLDLQLGSSRGDGTGGAERLARESRADPTRFVRLGADRSGLEGTRLAALSTQDGLADPAKVVAAFRTLIDDLAAPAVFFARLLNSEHARFREVETFFRNVVEPVTAAAGYRRVEIGTDETEHAFLNVAVFEELHYAPLVIADVTGERPNCFIELGYALGRGTRVLATAAKGTPLPFDEDKIPVHFFFPAADVEPERNRFRDFWRRNVNRPRLVS